MRSGYVLLISNYLSSLTLKGVFKKDTIIFFNALFGSELTSCRKRTTPNEGTKLVRALPSKQRKQPRHNTICGTGWSGNKHTADKTKRVNETFDRPVAAVVCEAEAGAGAEEASVKI